MKKLLLAALLFTSFSSFAQKDIEVNCYQKYAKVFEERGAENIPDGWYEDVIISIRYGSNADCYLGKVNVVEGRVVVKEMQIKFQDGSYEFVKRNYKHDFPVSIVAGISKTLVTLEDELINIMFVKHVKPKKKAYERAPEPTFDF
ncbi:MAG: hypothetical protein H0V01_07200 [Bacteroidetes bacterium]|nr:hypothetical protein [Bacteroidota bacterium]HET6244143.1 hypothetical protein [Bacteroidia bacterium]